jgi:hypothetical protein
MLETIALVLMHGNPFADLPTQPPSPVCEAGQIKIKKIDAMLVLLHTWLQSDELHEVTDYDDSDRYLDTQQAIARAQNKLKLRRDRLDKLCSSKLTG